MATESEIGMENLTFLNPLIKMNVSEMVQPYPDLTVCSPSFFDNERLNFPLVEKTRQTII